MCFGKGKTPDLSTDLSKAHIFMCFILIVVLSVILVIFILAKVRRVDDGYHIKQELTFDLLWAIVIVVCNFVKENEAAQFAMVIVAVLYIYHIATHKVRNLLSHTILFIELRLSLVRT